MLRGRRLAIAGAVVVAGVPIVGMTWAVAAGPGDPPASFAYARSTDGGTTFTPMQLDDLNEEITLNSVRAVNGTVHALFDNNTPGPGPDPGLTTHPGSNERKVLYRRSTNGGGSFAPSVRLDVGNGDSSESDLVADGATLHAAWEDDRPLDNGMADPALDRQRRNSACVSPPSSVCYTSAQAPNIDNRDDIMYVRSTDAGVSFSSPVNLSCGTGVLPRSAAESPFPVTDPTPDINPAKKCLSDEVHNTDPNVGAAGNLVVIAYEGQDIINGAQGPTIQTNGKDIFAVVSADGGTTWSAEKRLNADAANQDDPSVAVVGSTVHVAYDNLADNRIRLLTSTDGGTTWSPATTPLGATTAEAPNLLAHGTTLHLFACSVPTAPDTTTSLLYARSADGGATWSSPIVLSSHTDKCDHPKPALDSQGLGLHVVWEGGEAGQEAEIWHAKSTDGGLTWQPRQNISNNSHASEVPSISVDPANSSRVHVGWSDKSYFLLTVDSQQSLPLETGKKRKFEDEDVARYRGGAYQVVVDGGDVGLKKLAIDAMARLSDGDFVFSFEGAEKVPGVGKVDDSDLVRFSPTSLGENTAGTFTRYLKGADLGLTKGDEDIDALEIVGSDLYLSTRGPFTTSAPVLTGTDRDVFRCAGFTPAVGTTPASCTSIGVAFTGTPAGFDTSNEDVDAFAFDTVGFVPNEKGSAYFSTTGNYSLPGASGFDDDLVQCFIDNPPLAGPGPQLGLSDCGVNPAAPLRKTFDGPENGITKDLGSVEFEF